MASNMPYTNVRLRPLYDTYCNAIVIFLVVYSSGRHADDHDWLKNFAFLCDSLTLTSEKELTVNKRFLKINFCRKKNITVRGNTHIV